MIKVILLSLVTIITFFKTTELSPLSVYSFSFSSVTVFNGLKTTFEAETAYEPETGKLVSLYKKPGVFYLISNRKGECKMYHPSDSTVKFMTGKEYMTGNNPWSYFFEHKTTGFDLQEQGFELIKTYVEDPYLISEWKQTTPEVSLKTDKAKIVHQKKDPVYIEYSLKSKPVKKIFYSQYKTIGSYNLPHSITEIKYLSNEDSVVSRMTFSGVAINSAKDNSLFQFKIPDYAKKNTN